MDLVAKNQSAALESITGLLAKLTWSTARDFDVAALYKAKDGREGMVYFNSKGDLNAFPFAKLDKDDGVGAKSAGSKAETIRIAKLDEMAEMHIIAWDYTSIERGEAAQFDSSDVAVTLTDSNGTSHTAKLVTGGVGNVAVVATIKNGALGGELINVSKAGLLKSFNSTEQLWAIVKQA